MLGDSITDVHIYLLDLLQVESAILPCTVDQSADGLSVLQTALQLDKFLFSVAH